VHGEAFLSVGLSIGSATSPPDGSDSITMLAAADARLYENKASRKRATVVRALG
jgi:GGDEF domain-containing protein